MIKKILVPIAFSEFTQGILKFAVDLAVPLKADLMIVNIINERDLEAVERISSFGYKVDGDHYVQTLQKERLAELDSLFDKIDFPEEKTSFDFLAGDPSNELLKLVVTKDIDLIVMGIKNKQLRSIFAGSVAERMFRKSPVSIVSYRDEMIAERLRKRILKNMDR
jgi:nucleotide-binding universal stress UspA family protein